MSTQLERRFLLFVYGTMLAGERNHHMLEAAKLIGDVSTAPRYRLMDLGPSASLVDDGQSEVFGELYEVDVHTLAAVDVLMEHPVLFRRSPVELSDGRTAQAYLMGADQVRCKRRLHSGKWKQETGPPALHEPGPLVGWARRRFRR